MRRTTRFLQLALVLSLLFSAFVSKPLSAASTGTVELDVDFVTSPGGSLKVTVQDPDLDVGVRQEDVDKDFDGNALVTPALVANQTRFYRLPKFPILDHNEDGIVNFQDVVLDTTTRAFLGVLTLAPNSGLVTFIASTTVAAGTTFTVTYTAAEVQTHTVKVSSTQDATGFTLTVKETGATTGRFEATFRTATSTSDSINADDPAASSRPAIQASEGDLITVSYEDADPTGTRTTTATVETTKPLVVVTSPADGTASRWPNLLIAEVTDSAGVDTGTISFNIASAVDASGNPVAGVGTESVSTSAIPFGVRAESRLLGVPDDLVVTVTWNVAGSDRSGNVGRSDSDPDTEGDQDHILTIDTHHADLSVTKVDSPDPVAAHSKLTYTVVVTNNGPGDATGVALVDTLPPTVSFASADATQGSCGELNGTVTCDLGDMANGASATVTIGVLPLVPSPPTPTPTPMPISEVTDYRGNPYTQPASLSLNAIFFARVQKFPIGDNNGDALVDFRDVQVSIGSIAVLSVDTKGGLITFIVFVQVASDTPFTVTYTAAEVAPAGPFTANQVNEATDLIGNAYTQPASLAVGGTFFARVQNFPLQDGNGDGVVNFLDVEVSTSSISVLNVDSAGGLVTFLVETQVATDTPFTVSYTAGLETTPTPTPTPSPPLGPPPPPVTNIASVTGYERDPNGTNNTAAEITMVKPAAAALPGAGQWTLIALAALLASAFVWRRWRAGLGRPG